MDETQQSGDGRKKRAALIVFALCTLAGLIGIYFYVQYKKTHITTDDAYVEGRVHTVASRVPGTVSQVLVSDNQFVKKGELLLTLDVTDYAVRTREAASAATAERSRLSEINTRISTAQTQLSEYRYRAGAARANLELQEAGLRQAALDLGRAENLLRKEAIPRERFDRTRTAYDVASFQVKAARDQLSLAEAAIETQKAIVRQAESALTSQKSLIGQKDAAREAVELSMSYTRIHAPSDGHVTRKSVETGNQVQAGQPLMAVVSLDDIWIIANYKETQLEKIRKGQGVEIRVDTYPDKKFRGRVDSIMAGTGAVFSLFPPENATGNFVKVVQRVPVKIVLDEEADREHLLRIGMSVISTVVLDQ